MHRIFRPGLALVAFAVAAATGFPALHAHAQSAPTATPPRAEKPATPTQPAPAQRRPRDDSDSAQAIEDDPTVDTGDEQESADSNLSFPVDI